MNTADRATVKKLPRRKICVDRTSDTLAWGKETYTTYFLTDSLLALFELDVDVTNPVFFNQVLFPAKDGVVWVGCVDGGDTLVGAEKEELDKLFEEEYESCKALIPRGPSMDDLESCYDSVTDESNASRDDASCDDADSNSSLSIISESSDADHDENDTEDDIDIDIETEDIDISDIGEEAVDAGREW